MLKFIERDTIKPLLKKNLSKPVLLSSKLRRSIFKAVNQLKLKVSRNEALERVSFRVTCRRTSFPRYNRQNNYNHYYYNVI